MQRIFTKSLGNFKKGDIKDYPQGTWNSIEQSANRPLNEFTKPLSDVTKFGIEMEDGQDTVVPATTKMPRQLRTLV